jgi:hypothetical protein
LQELGFSSALIYRQKDVEAAANTAHWTILVSSALLYLAAGYWCGRFVDRPEAESLGLPVALAVAACAFVQVGYAMFQLLLGTEVVASAVAGRIIVPTILLTGLLSFPVMLVARRLLGAPMDVEPGMLRT